MLLRELILQIAACALHCLLAPLIVRERGSVLAFPPVQSGKGCLLTSPLDIVLKEMQLH